MLFISRCSGAYVQLHTALGIEYRSRRFARAAENPRSVCTRVPTLATAPRVAHGSGAHCEIAGRRRLTDPSGGEPCILLSSWPSYLFNHRQPMQHQRASDEQET
jgi:hypothetical protein